MSPFLAFALVAPPPKDLSEYLAAYPWNVAQGGPLLALEPERARAEKDGTFGRQRVKVGGITALVPPTRVDIDDSLRQEPNLYEGLPADAKVLYLLRSLSPEQWRVAAARGLGFADLQGEQRLVFESILPKRFGWTANRLDKVGFGARTPEREP